METRAVKKRKHETTSAAKKSKEGVEETLLASGDSQGMDFIAFMV